MQQSVSGASRWLCRNLLGFAASVWVAGCVTPPPEAEVRLSEVKLQGMEIDHTLDLLEERLLVSQANVELWQEMARRHRNVSALACGNAEDHLKAMVKNLGKKGKGRVAKRGHLASAPPVISQASAKNAHRRD